ncbi:MAG: phage portal protein [Nocardioides sp.]|nr:phage portal protein [Nocardioides sp.]
MLIDLHGQPLHRPAANFRSFDAGKSSRRLRALPTFTSAINDQIKAYGASVLARSRYLAVNNGYAAKAREEFVSALVGSGITPAPMLGDADLKAELQEVWRDWTDEADADWLTDFYGLQSLVAGEMFEAGECFIRLRPRYPEDGLVVPLQIQLLPAEMLPLEKNEDLGAGRRIECGIEFDAIGRRTAYHFRRRHPGAAGPGVAGGMPTTETTAVPAAEVLHLYKPMRAGQIRGVPHTISAIATLALLDMYDDAELERKRLAALFGAFIIKPELDSDPLGMPEQDAAGRPFPEDPVPALEPGATIDLQPGEDIKFAEPADVGGSYEPFQYRNLLRAAAGFGVPYASMTGDLRSTSYGSIRAGLVEFRRRIESMQHQVMVHQFCRPVWNRWLLEGALAGAFTIGPAEFKGRVRELRRVEWMPPKWEWIDPLKDLQAEKLAVDSGFKPRSAVIKAQGYDPEEVDRAIRQDRDREEELGLAFGDGAPPPASTGEARPATGNEEDD